MVPPRMEVTGASLSADSHRLSYSSGVCQLCDLEQIMSTLDLSFSIYNVRVIIARLSQDWCKDSLWDAPGTVPRI